MSMEPFARCRTLVALVLLLAWAGLAWFNAPAALAQGLSAEDAAELERALSAAANVAAGNQEAYLAARTDVLAFGVAAIPHLEEHGAAEKWNEETWRLACVAMVARNHLAGEDWIQAVERPFGLDRANYSQFRRPIPSPARDFVRLGTKAVPHLLERFLWTFEEYPFSEENAEEERAALREALLFVPGRLEDERAVPFLHEVVRDPDERAVWRRVAARSLGQAGGAEASGSLLALLEAPRLPHEARRGIIRGLGHTYTGEALEAIRAELSASLGEVRSEEQAARELRRRLACIEALGTIGNWMAWRLRFPDEPQRAERMRERAAMPLVRLLATERTEHERREITVALNMIASQESLDALRKLAERDDLDEATREAVERAVRVVNRSVERRQSRIERDQQE